MGAPIGVLPHEANHVSGGVDAFLTTDVLDAIVKRIQTTTGPTTMLVGAVADGQFLKRSGTAIIGAAAGTTFTVSSSQTTGFTVDGTATTWICTAAGGSFAATLVAANSVANGYIYIFKKTTAANAVTITAAGADTIDGQGTKVMTAINDSVTIVSDGSSKWYVI